MDYFPIFVDLRGQDVLLVGGGAVAERKARLLLAAGARVHVAATELNQQFEQWLQQQRIVLLGPTFQTEQLDGKRLVFAATDDTGLNQHVFEQADARGILANVVDDPRHCRFLSPAVIDRSPVQVAISTGGSAPLLARVIRGWMERLLPLGLGQVARLAGEFRDTVKQSLPFDARRPFWQRMLSEQNIRRWSLQSPQRVLATLRDHLDSELQAGPAQQQTGQVFLVGAGPGRADLLTLRALQVLGQADVILHDRLVSDEVLDLARRDAERVFVGKVGGGEQVSQQRIHELMLEHARLGRSVVRLKGGDVMIFGRGGEEAEFLRQHDIPFEIVPGITAAIACGAFAGIPLTHRLHAHSLTFLTGHTPQADTHWAAIAGPGRTVAIYMGARQAGRLRDEILAAGLPDNLPVAVVVNASMPSQQVRTGALADLVELTRSASSQASAGDPALLLIGQVAALSGSLNWFNHELPLSQAA